MQKPFLYTFLLILLTCSFLQAQFPDPFQEPEQNQILGGAGVTWIDGQSYTTLTLAPDIAIGKFGMGIYLQLLFDNENSLKLREDEYKDGAGILRAIRYLRLGQKYDSYFFRVGSLDRASLGNGFLVWNYNNASNYEKRKMGLTADVDFDFAGFETVWSSVGTSNMRGANVFIRPLKLANVNAPVLDKLRLYSTYVRDSQVSAGTTVAGTDSLASLSAYGFGADLFWLDFPFVKSSIYGDYSKFENFGDGQAVGVNLIFPEFIGLFGLAAKFERRFLGGQFIPGLFGPLYELYRQTGLLNQNSGFIEQSMGIFDQLQSAEKAQGYFGQLSGHVINRIRLMGSFQKLNGIDNSGILHLEASAPNLIPLFELRAYYDKAGINGIKDARTLDANSLLTAELGYQVNSFLFMTMLYRWHWRELQNDAGEGTGIFKPVERIEPRLTLRYNF